MRVSVRAQLLAAFGVVLGLMLVVGLLAVARLATDYGHVARLANSVVPSTRAVGDVYAVVNKYRKDQFHYIAARPADRPLGVEGSVEGDLRGDLSVLRDRLHAYRSQGLVQDAADRRLVDAFETHFRRYLALTRAFRPLADRGRLLEAGQALGDGPGDDEWDAIKAVIAAWNDHKVETAARAERSSQASYRHSVLLIVALLAAAIALATLVAIVLARRTTRAVGAIGLAAKAVAQGDIDQRVAVRSRDELGDMAQDFDGMIEYLRTTVGVAEAIAAGRLDVEIRPRSERDVLGTALAAMTQSLRELAAANERLLAETREEANTDALTGLPNRRALLRDLETALGETRTDGPGQLMLALFDLDGFKHYNDTFGHPAGDVLLARLGDRLTLALADQARAYRMGGDEFCVLGTVEGNAGAAIARRAASALEEHGEAFRIGCSYGVAVLPGEASTPEEALRVADQRMYANKSGGRASASRQSADVLLKVLSERNLNLPDHVTEVAQLAGMLAESFELPEHEVQRIRLAAELHDIGKAAIPDAILDKPGPLDDEEWQFIRRHSEIGERIVAAAPSLAHTGDLVRSHHERWDGQGYPDRLAGCAAPLGARIIAVADAFAAMIAVRPYSDAIAVADALTELRRCAGTQFDPDVVAAFCRLLERPEALAGRGA